MAEQQSSGGSNVTQAALWAVGAIVVAVIVAYLIGVF